MRNDVEVLVVGAGPTGLTLALQLAAFGVRPRIVDRGLDRVHESRALAILPRTLEVLAGLEVTADLLACGNPAVQMRLHVRGRVLAVPLFDLGLDDTAYPHLLFLSQAETERVLEEHLARAGVSVERGVELVSLRGTPDDGAVATLRHRGGSEEHVPAGYVAGCDGAHSTVRGLAGIPFRGGSYPQSFVLADVEADGIEPGAAHAFLADRGLLLFFPLGWPASWRLIAMRPPTDPTPPDALVTLDEIQSLADAYVPDTVRLRDPVWMTNFRLHHRVATHYRAGRVFIAGDAAHIHSPAGAQGMNTGIQDATNLGWKLAHTIRSGAGPALLGSYEPERAPIGRRVLRFTDRAFTVGTSTNPVVRFARTRLGPAIIPLALKTKVGRATFIRAVSQLGINYRRSPLSVNGPNPPSKGPRAGDRLPDANFVHCGRTTSLHRETAAPGWHLLLCGPLDDRAEQDLAALRARYTRLVTVHLLATTPAAGELPDPDGAALRRLGLTRGDTAQYLMRPVGHVGYRAGGTDLTGLAHYLARWLSHPRPGVGQ